MRLFWLALLTVLAAAPALADDATEIAFWDSVRDSGSAAELQAYLDAYPHGEFAALAELRLKKLGGAAAPAGPAAAAPVQSAPAPAVSVRAVDAEYRAFDRITVEIDASALARGSNWRIAVVPKTAGDAVVNPDAFASVSTPVDPAFGRLSVHPGTPGDDEVRLYYIPASGDSFVLAGRGPVRVDPPQENATAISDLQDEAAASGPVGFEAKYRGKRLLIEGAFSRLVTDTTGPDWNSLIAGLPSVPQRFVALYIGEGGMQAPDEPEDLTCLMSAEDDAVVQRLATLRPGDDLLLIGEATTWNGGLVINPCGFGN